MAFTGMSLKQMIDDFNKRGIRPHGRLLTLSRYAIAFDREYFNRICQYGRWESQIDDDSFINDEIVFKALGFEHLDSMDYSEHEYATIIHDLNDNIPTKLENKYDFILDGGTIEHVFDFKNVMANIFKMLKVGGTFFFDQPTFFGFNHGYYNFSPCLYYEYFKANNYEINAFIPYAHKDGFIYIADPAINNVCGHIPLIENSKNLVWGSVTKTSETTFGITPYQGIYEGTWKSSPNIRFGDVLDSVDEKSVYLYGTGYFVRDKLQMLPLKYRNKIAGLLSKETHEIGQMMYGYKVYAIEEIADSCRTIMITTSKQYQDIVYDRIKHLENTGIKIIRLFQKT